MKSQALFAQTLTAVKSKGADLVKLDGAVNQFVISDAGPEGKFTLDLKNGDKSATVGENPKADCIITIADAVYQSCRALLIEALLIVSYYTSPISRGSLNSCPINKVP